MIGVNFIVHVDFNYGPEHLFLRDGDMSRNESRCVVSIEGFKGITIILVRYVVIDFFIFIIQKI